MRTLILAGLTMVTALGAGAADAQRIGGPGAPYPVPPVTADPGPPPPPPPVRAPGYPARPYPQQGYPQQGYPQRGDRSGSRWGGQVGGRWYGGAQAPGGWSAYRRPSRGWHVPSYWNSPGFYIGDYAGYGLYAPPAGYGWHRYYDDAVLLDGRGRVYDSRGGIDWDGGEYGYGYGYGSDGYAEYGRGGYGYAPVEHNGAVTTYHVGGYGGGYGGSTTTVVTIQPSETVTTTTTEYVERTRYAAPRRIYHRVTCGCARPVHRVVRRHVERPILGS